MADYDERLRQAQELARLLGQPEAQTWVQKLALLARMGLDEPGDWTTRPQWSWVQLLSNQPQLADRVPDWTMFSAADCYRILQQQPQLLSWMSPDWDDLDPLSWVKLLQRHPHLAEVVPEQTWHKLSTYDDVALLWQLLLLEHPQLARYCTKRKETCYDRARKTRTGL
jgi:hypothetical protein